MAVPKEILKSIRDTKPLSESAHSLMAMVADPDHSFQEFIRIVENDPILTGSVLRVVNSAAYALRSEVDTVRRAVTVAGENTVIGIALGMCADHLFNDPLDGYESERGALWRHSLRTAIASREISRFAEDHVNPGSAYTAGILHDIGKSVISAYLEGTARDNVRSADEGETEDYLEAERKVVGTDHGEVGGALAEMWQLPIPLREAVAYHHSPDDASAANRPLVYTVHLGDFVAMMGGTGTGSDTLLYQLNERYKDYIAINARELEELVFRVGLEFKKTVNALFVGEEETK